MDILPFVIEQICITSHAGVPPTSIRYQLSTKRYRDPPRLQAVAHELSFFIVVPPVTQAR
jgi:hypothetical protein